MSRNMTIKRRFTTRCPATEADDQGTSGGGAERDQGANDNQQGDQRPWSPSHMLNLEEGQGDEVIT